MDDAALSLMADVSKYRFNPAAIQRASLKLLDGHFVVDPTNPFVFCLENSAVLVSAFLAENAAMTRQRYPRMAQVQEDLYYHMSDQDYVGRFATPAKATFTMLFPKQQLLNSLVLEPSTGYSKVTIPRNTFFEVAGLQFALQYPIDIRQMAHGGLQIVYDNTIASPLQTLTTNALEPETLTNQDGDWIKIDVPTQQFKIATTTGSISSAIDLVLTLPLDDQFYYGRAYYQNGGGDWIEMTTTHSAIVYDATKPTAVFTVESDVLTVKIPGIYVSSGMLTGKVRVDAYQTKGAINIPLDQYNTNATAITWRAIDKAEMNIYSAPLPGISVIGYSNDIVIDGANGVSFEILRDKVIQNTTGPIDIPITPADIETKLINVGYDVVKHVDNITDRVFLATRSMPDPTVITPTTAASTGKALLTAAAASIETLSISTMALAQLPTVIDNNTSITITPDTLYKIVDGVTTAVTKEEIASILAMSPDKRAQQVNQNSYLWTPFHYVLDMTNNAFEMRPYYLDNPNAESKVFVSPNDTTLMQLTTGQFSIIRNETGYMVQLVTKSDETYKALPDNKVFAQLSFVPVGERDRAYLNGVLVGKTNLGERIFDFDLATTFNVNANNHMELTKFTMYNNEPRITLAKLVDSFDILYSTSVAMSSVWVPNSVDKALGKHLLPQQIAGITQETLKLKFGDVLDMLWTRARTVVGSTPYKVWQVDVPAVYAEDIYLRDENGSAIRIVNGQPVSTILHPKGSAILDNEGNPSYEHRKGEVMLDGAGKPVPVNVRGLIRQIDMLLIEGAYWFATDATTTNYRTKLTTSLVAWLVKDLATFKGKLLDQTRIYFYPKTTSGVINVIVGNNIRKSILAGQSLTLTLAVSKFVKENLALQDLLKQVTITTISDLFLEPTVSTSKIITALRAAYGDDVIDISLTGLGGDANHPVMTVLDATDRCSIRKRLVAQADESLIVEEDITLVYVVHGQ